MRLVLTLLLALALTSCGKKSDDKKPEATQESRQEQVQTQRDPVTPGRDTETTTPEVAATPDQENKPTPSRDAKADPLKNKRWKLVKLNGETIKVTEDFKSDPYISFSAHTNKLTGSGGCNRFGCKYFQDGNKLSMNGFASTKMLCQDAMDVETPFLQELAAVNGYTMDGEDKLWLTRDGKRVMEFDALYLN